MRRARIFRALRTRGCLCRWLVLLPLLLAGCGGTREYEAALLVADIAAGSSPSRLKSVTEKPSRTEVSLPAAGGSMAGDLYLPREKPLAGILLLPGAAETGKDDPRLTAFAESLARARFAVLVPDMANFRSLRVSGSDVGETARAFAWLAARDNLAPGGRAGMIAFSYAAGPALLAALEPGIAAKVQFVMAVGGYYDLKSVLTFFTTGYFRAGERWRHMEPNSYGKWLFVRSNIGRLKDPGDRELFREAVRRKLIDDKAGIADLESRLTPEGRNLLDFIDNRDPARAPTLMGRLAEPIRRDIALLDVASRDLSRLKARLILVHGYEDDIIPYTESVALASKTPPGQASLYLVHGLMHVDLEPGMKDKFRLWRAMSELLGQRSR